MIKITSPIQDSILYNTSILVEYEVTENSKFTDKVIIYVDGTKYEKVELKGRFQATGLQEGKHTIKAYLVNKYNKKIVGSEVKYFFYTNTDIIDIKNRITNVIPSQIPEFIRKDYDRFVKFIEYYYLFLESSNDPKLVPMSSSEFSDVDRSPTIFNEKFRKQFIPDFPSEFTIDVETGKPLNLKTLIKRASEFYRSKGTQNSFNFIFRILFDQDIQFYYPREHMFIVSGANWVEKKTVKVIVFDIPKARLLENNIIYQVNDAGIQIASARVVSCLIYKQSPYTVAELELTEISPIFDESLPILCDVIIDDAEEQLSYYLTRGVVSLEITSPGYNYQQGDRIFLEPISGQVAEGVGFAARIDKVNPMGRVLSIIVVNFGVNYESDLTGRYTISDVAENGVGIEATGSTDVMFNYEGYYASSNGVLSERSFIQDNNYYQTHSYEIISSLPLSSYYDVIKRTVHPAGYKLFGSQIVTPRIILVPTTENYQSDILTTSSYYIGNYIAYRMNGDVNLRDTTVGLNPDMDLFPEGVNMINPIPPDSDGYFIHHTNNSPETTDIDGASFENFVEAATLIPDWDQRYTYWVVFPHPSVLINNTNGSIDQFLDLQIQDMAVVQENVI